MDFITSTLNPVIRILKWAGLIQYVQQIVFVDFLIRVGIYRDAVEFLTESVALSLLGTVILIAGTAADVHYGKRVIGFFHRAVSRLPAVGAIYSGFRQMGDMMLQSDVEHFRDVKFVEVPQ